MTAPTRLILDAATLRFCATLARTAAEGVRQAPDSRAHHGCAAAALETLAEEIEGIVESCAA